MALNLLPTALDHVSCMLVGFCGGCESTRRLCTETLMSVFSFERVDLNDGNVAEVLHRVTGRWRDNFVLPTVSTMTQWEELSKRPFFLLVNIQKPYASKRLEISDIQLQVRSGIVLFHSGSVEDLACAVRTHLAPSRLARLARPEWDAYFMRIAEFSAQRTNCMKRAVGAILVFDRTIIATGYNGTARGTTNCMDGGCPRCNCAAIRCGQALDSCLCLHAEENAIIEAGRTRARGATLYTTMSPCLSCAKKICQVGIERVVYGQDYTPEHFSAELFKQAGIVLERKQAVNAGPMIIATGNHAVLLDKDNDSVASMNNLHLTAETE